MTKEKKIEPKKKGIFARIFDMLDNMLKEKADSAPCCGSGGKDKGSCC